MHEKNRHGLSQESKLPAGRPKVGETCLLLSAEKEKTQQLNAELQKSQEKIKKLENSNLHSHSSVDQEHTWGTDSWGTQSDWEKNMDKENEHLW